jgi:hypothetical protein
MTETAILSLEKLSNDDPAFLNVAGRLIAGAASVRGWRTITVVHIDHWFGGRWLGFCGKLLGIAGVRTRDLSGTLTPPPFHPNRVLSEKQYERLETEYVDVGDRQWLHRDCTSQQNLSRKIYMDGLYAWYSGDTTATDKGAVMVYEVFRRTSDAWYVRFDKTKKWRVAQTVRISPQRVQQLIGSVVTVPK